MGQPFYLLEFFELYSLKWLLERAKLRLDFTRSGFD